MAARDNPFYIEPVNAMQALMSGVQGYDRSQAQQKEQEMQAGRQAAMAALQGGGDLRSPLAKLIGIGDTKGAEQIANFAHHQATEQQAKAQQAQQAGQFGLTHQLHQQQFDLAKAQADAAAKGLDYREVEVDGEKRYIKTDKATGKAELVPIGGLETDTKSPYAPTGKLTESEANARNYANRMAVSHNILTKHEDINSGAGGYLSGALAGKPWARDSNWYNLLAPEDRQKVIQAQRNFVTAVLRKESGATIQPPEFENEVRKYFPMPGDGEEVIKQKREARQLVIEGMMQGAGKGYKPPTDYVGTKGAAYPKPNTTTLKNGDVIDWTSLDWGKK